MKNIEEIIAKAIRFNKPHRLFYDETEEMARAILSALKSAGLVIVPEEPTEAMIKAADIAYDTAPHDRIYRAMIRAATA